MILVVGRPGLGQRGQLHGSAALVALAAAEAGSPVEIVGSVGDDPDGDAVALALGRAGVGHAALLRDPAGVTPRERVPAEEPLPRLDARDIELGLSYLPECRVLVVAEALDRDALRAARQAAEYHAAQMIVLVPVGESPPRDVPSGATVLQTPEADGGAFASLVGRYAAALADGRSPDEAWQDALGGSGWQEAGDAGEAGEDLAG